MIKSAFLIPFSLMLTLLFSCKEKPNTYVVEITNELDIARSDVMVEVPKSEFAGMLCEEFSRFGVTDPSSGEKMPSQVIDTDMDGMLDIMVFQATVGAGETKKYQLTSLAEAPVFNDLATRAFSRFVPERTDDYAWENDRVAFRTYGPIAQKMIEDGTPGGTLSSGIDCWLKRVDYPIIDKWYRKHLEEGGSYHKDTGEGLDDFHVGPSRGCGGIGIWEEDESMFYTSRNFSEWKTITQGPLRTQFELTYQPWNGPEGEILETKIITLDMGSNLMKVEVYTETEKPLEAITAGITLYEENGHIQVDEENGWFSYWLPHGDSELGMAIVAETGYVSGFTEFISQKKIESHLLVHLKPQDGRVVYYTGFAWKKAGLFTNEQEWNNYLGLFSRSLESKLIVKVLH